MSSPATSMLWSPCWCTSSACIFITLLGAYWATSLPKVTQVLVSIQSMILVNDPYYNAPSLEDGRSSSRLGQQAQAYNHKIQRKTVQHAMLDNLAQPPAGFDQIIKYASCLRHFHNEYFNEYTMHRQASPHACDEMGLSICNLQASAPCRPMHFKQLRQMNISLVGVIAPGLDANCCSL